MLTNLALTNFRSYSNYSLDLHPNCTLIIGPNASGKTNLLEAVFVLATTKSFRAKDLDLVRYGQDHYRITGNTDGTNYALGYQNQGGASKKKVTHNGAAKTLSGHLGKLLVTLFEPSDLEIATGAPEYRRRYLDYVLCQTDKDYLHHLNLYKRVLKQRNRLLGDFAIGDIKDQIFTWDLKLAESAVEIFNRRKQLLKRLNHELPDFYRDIAGHEVEIKLQYLPSIQGDYADNFLPALAGNLTRDLAAGFTTIGPHREDFEIKFKGQRLDRVASRGEVRSLVLAMKFGELGYVESVSGRKPMLLLDDVFSELDPMRRKALVKRLRGYQSLITTTEAEAVPAKSLDYKIVKTGGKHVG